MKMMVGDNLTPEQLQQLVDRQMVQADTDNDGKLSYEEFKAAVKDIATQIKILSKGNTLSTGMHDE